MEHCAYLDDLFGFLDQSPTAFHATANGAALLAAHGFRRLNPADSWCDLPAGCYYTIHNDSSLLALTLPEGIDGARPLRMAGAHTDSPSLKIKPNPVQLRHTCVQLGVEIYGGALLLPWFDRPLSLAGRVSWKSANGPMRTDLFDFRRPVAIIPSLAIHLDREANDKGALDKQNALVPLLMQTGEQTAPDFRAILAERLVQEHPEAVEAEVLDFDAFLYDPQPASTVGLHGEFISAPRLDNLLSCHALLQALVLVSPRQNSLVILNDHEEVGSLSTAGAQGPLLQNTLERLFPDPQTRQRMLASSLLVSVDNAHAVHPNFAAKHDPEHLPLLNRGPVIKMNANQRYATNSTTAGLFRLLCRAAEVPCQQFVMRNDLACGSTIGPLTAAAIGVATVDIGVPQLAMHSVRETAGALDGWHLLRVMTSFFSASDDAIRCPEIHP